jgi:phage gp36-like protein
MTTVAFGLLPRFRSPLPEYLRIFTLFCALGAAYLLLRGVQQRRLGNA